MFQAKQLSLSLTLLCTALLFSHCGDQNSGMAPPEAVQPTFPKYFDSEEVLNPVQIGAQAWADKNLAITHFKNGDTIMRARTDAEWRKAWKDSLPAWCCYDNSDENGHAYGLLYNWYALHDPRGLAPEGWHTPRVKEWTELTEYLGGYEGAGIKMKTDTGWANGGKGTNESGFNGLAGGMRLESGGFIRQHYFGYWWSESSVHGEDYLCYTVYYDHENVVRHYNHKGFGASVRCLQGDAPADE